MEPSDHSDVEELHYYCSAATFLSLVKSKKLWLTDLTLSNDTQEGRYAVKQYLDSFLRKRTKESLVRRNGARLALDIALKDRCALGMCFSEDDDLLSQWRGYADNGAGLCVTFSRPAIEEIVEGNIEGLPGLSLAPVSYDRIERMDLPSQIHSVFKERIDGYSENETGGGSVSWGQSKEQRKSEIGVISKLYEFKNPAFKEEREWRLYWVGEHSDASDLDYREASGIISPKVEITYPSACITRVRLGPRNPTPSNVVQRMMNHFGCNARVRTSTASFTTRGN
ncbi:DUF2971 domain-containing protein [Leisingera sp. M658]|uniref:DUF2971 domain-containing protein n=1 Tax=Leisingera sp. M658 TaxID=2867015 RepID=UPI0021A47FCD|nr:DUF2971 domain-containing protein [Leisingera sp. M658]UWQ73303.1 DUF2971 domain-containing protein [Leisingera sp. M658]